MKTVVAVAAYFKRGEKIYTLIYFIDRWIVSEGLNAHDPHLVKMINRSLLSITLWLRDNGYKEVDENGIAIL